MSILKLSAGNSLRSPPSYKPAFFFLPENTIARVELRNNKFMLSLVCPRCFRTNDKKKKIIKILLACVYVYINNNLKCFERLAMSSRDIGDLSHERSSHVQISLKVHINYRVRL